MALYSSPQSVFEAAARQYSVKVACPQCPRWKIFDPHALWWLFERKGWNDRLKVIANGRFRCTSCGGRSVKIELVREEPTGTQPPMPQERDWKRAANRYRG